MADESVSLRRRSIRKSSQSSYILCRNAQKELREKMRKVSIVLKKPEHERTAQDKVLVKKNPDLVIASMKNARKLQATKERILEVEDESHLLVQKCKRLADLIKSSRNIVVYTGAGISTAASIPDYRGPNGVWTLLKKGQELRAQDLSDAEPTITHMSLTKLFKVGKVKHIVSQNCDGLHIRSGFPRHAISEVHGNMYIECCYSCSPHKEFVRLFDVTERTGVHRHTTSRCCRSCGGNLQDTIVHFGEKGKLKSPYRWKEAVRAAKRADLILCFGSSLKVLRKYSCLWCMDKKPQYRPKLVIVNLQWTPKDVVATLKINGRCDDVMKKVMATLNYEVPKYEREKDPIFQMCTLLRASERKTTTKKILILPSKKQKPGNQSRNKACKSATLKRSTRCKKSAKKPQDLQVESLMDFSSPVNSELCNDKPESSINMCPVQQTAHLSPIYYPVMAGLLQLQGRPTLTSTTDYNYYSQSLQDYTHKHSLETAVLSDLGHEFIEPNELLSFTATQGIHSHLPLEKEAEHTNIHTSALENTSLSKQELDSNLINSLCYHNTPELVVVNLGNDQSICHWDPGLSGDKYIFSNHVPHSEAVVCLHNWAIDDKIAEQLVNDHNHVLSEQTRNACKSSISKSLQLLSYTTDVISNNHLSDKTELKMEVNYNFDCLLNTNMSKNRVLYPTEEVLSLCSNSVTNNGLVHRGSDISTNNTHQCKDYKSLLEYQPILDKITNICLDHNYTLPESLTHKHQIEDSLYNNCKHTQYSPICCSPAFINSVSNHVSSQGSHSKSHPYANKPSLPDKCSKHDTKSLHFKSPQESDHVDCNIGSRYVANLSPLVQLVSKTQKAIDNSVNISRDHSSNMYTISDVPSCILNMDDLEAVHRHGTQSDLLPLGCNDQHITNVVEIATELFPWDNNVLVIPSAGERSILHSKDAPSNLQTDEAMDAQSLLELQLVQSVQNSFNNNNNSTFSCSENYFRDSQSDPFTDMCTEPNLHSFINSKNQNINTFNYIDNKILNNTDQCLAKLEKVCDEPINKMCKYHLRNSFETLARSEEVDETQATHRKSNKKKPQLKAVKKNKNSYDKNKQGQENVCRKVYKRKETLASIPGWFGKGFMVKKYRR